MSRKEIAIEIENNFKKRFNTPCYGMNWSTMDVQTVRYATRHQLSIISVTTCFFFTVFNLKSLFSFSYFRFCNTS
jgi:predicted nucleic acid-binding protein